MIALPEDIHPHDVRQWLGSGVFFASPEPGAEQWRLAWLDDEGPEVVEDLEDEDGSEIVELQIPEERRILVRWVATRQASYVGLQDIRCHWPTCGAINVPDHPAVYVERLQVRQYRRTYNAQCTRTHVPGQWFLFKQGKLRGDITESAGLLKALFYPEYPATVGKAYARLRELGSVAINRHITLVGDPGSPEVYYRTARAGVIAPHGFQPYPGFNVNLRKLLGEYVP
jgi:hypothetical protein